MQHHAEMHKTVTVTTGQRIYPLNELMKYCNRLELLNKFCLELWESMIYERKQTILQMPQAGRSQVQMNVFNLHNPTRCTMASG
jgi:hypothetical protein